MRKTLDTTWLLRHSRFLYLNKLPSAFATVSAPGLYSSVVQYLACDLPYRRCAVNFKDAGARLGAGVARFSFTASDSHRLLPARLPAHCEKLGTLPRINSEKGNGDLIVIEGRVLSDGRPMQFGELLLKEPVEARMVYVERL